MKKYIITFQTKWSSYIGESKYSTQSIIRELDYLCINDEYIEEICRNVPLRGGYYFHHIISIVPINHAGILY